jgi:hypothetical protein
LTFGAAAVASRSRNLRSAITNNPFVLAGVDGRSAAGRRYRDIMDGIIAEYGFANLDRVRELAALMMTREAAQAAVVKGDLSAAEDLVRVANLISRRERELRAKARRHESEQPAEGLRGKLSTRYAGKGGAP